ncbi:MAG: hypothetical protein ABJL67_15605, partial [Sulfitobacter sp.]
SASYTTSQLWEISDSAVDVGLRDGHRHQYHLDTRPSTNDGFGIPRCAGQKHCSSQQFRATVDEYEMNRSEQGERLIHR